MLLSKFSPFPNGGEHDRADIQSGEYLEGVGLRRVENCTESSMLRVMAVALPLRRLEIVCPLASMLEDRENWREEVLEARGRAMLHAERKLCWP